MTMTTIRGVLERCWDAETTADVDNWSSANPSYGQCAVTALLVQDQLGGELMRTTVDGVSHYFNQLPDGELVDLTFDQFPEGSAYDEEPVVRDRDYVIGFPATKARYDVLADRFRSLAA